MDVNASRQSTMYSVKDIINSKIKETQAKEMVNIYIKKYNNTINNNHTDSKSILEYDFITGKKSAYPNNNNTKHKTLPKCNSQPRIPKQKQLHTKQQQTINNKPKHKHKRTHQMKEDVFERLYQQPQRIAHNKQLTITNNSNNNDERVSPSLPFDEWYLLNKTLNQMRQAKLNYLKKQVNHIKTTQHNLSSIEETFYPHINHTSLSYFNSSSSNELQSKLHSHFKRINSSPSFTPQINKRYPIKHSYYNYMHINHHHLYNDLTNQHNNIIP